MKVDKPWGSYEILSESPEFKIKKIVVKENESLSYQSHHKRNENWVAIQGEAIFTLDDKDIVIKKGQSVYIPKLSKHKIRNENKEDFVFIEVQTGEYFGEDDIVRLEDKYGRK